MKFHCAKLKTLILRRVRAAGLNWADLDQSAKQIIVFGSYALSANTHGSDLDVLCIGDGNRYKSSKLHIIWIPERRTHSKRWLSSELATHVAAYGVWIKGENDWAYQTKPGRATITRKKKNIIARLNAITRHWDELLPKFQRGQVMKMRRDLQRYQIMQRGQAPLPKTLLDAKWQQLKASDGWETLLDNHSDVARRVRKFLIARKIP